MGVDESLPINEIKKRVLSAFFNLTIRQIFLRAFSFLTLNIILAKVLPVETLGVFNIAAGIVTFFVFFSDIGLAASLIQKKEGLKKEDIYTTFTIQTILVGLLSLLIIIVAPFLADFYKLEADGVWLIRALGLGFFFTSLKVVPSVLLERELKFKPVVTVELVETLVFNILLIVLTFQNFGLWAFTYASLTRSVLGVILIYLIAPTRVGIKIEKEAAKKLLSFGVPFQLNSMLAVLKDRLVPLVIANMVGPMGVGYITWAQNMAYLPLEFMNIVIRIIFPAFSRLQNDKVALSKAVEKALFVVALLTFPALFGLAGLMPAIITHIVSAKWQPALFSFYLFAFSNLMAIISTTLTNTLNAVGKVKTTLKLMVMWTVLTWLITPTVVYYYGFEGVSISSFLISFSSIVTIILVKQIIPIKIVKSIYIPTLCSFLMGVTVLIFANYFVTTQFMLFATVFLGGLLYLGLVLIFGRVNIINDLKSLRQKDV